MIAKEQLLQALKDGKIVYNHVWWFIMHDNGNIFGGCGEPDCCTWDFDNFEDMYNSFEEDEWKL